jgi:hypothetical protein
VFGSKRKEQWETEEDYIMRSFINCTPYQILLGWDLRFPQRWLRSRDRAVGIATGYGLDDRGVGVQVPVGSRLFSSPRRPDRL